MINKDYFQYVAANIFFNFFFYKKYKSKQYGPY